MKIGYLGLGAWGFCLSILLAKKGYHVKAWSAEEELIDILGKKRSHPRFPGVEAPKLLSFTKDLSEVVCDADLLVESVTSAGIRPVFEKIKKIKEMNCPIVLTSKGIEQKTGLLLSDVVVGVLGEEFYHRVACISGPSHAEEVIEGQPSSVACSSRSQDLMLKVKDIFSTPLFRVYPNGDIQGVEFGGAMKNIIAIACGISDGLGFGDNAKAALMTRGLHEIRKLALVKGAASETLNGLSGMGDLCVTCLSVHSRNYRFGRLIAEGFTLEEAKEKIGQVVEGVYTCVSACELAAEADIPLPITEGVFAVLFKKVQPLDVVELLMRREVKEEHL